jgi:AraC-like DNA-binding protein
VDVISSLLQDVRVQAPLLSQLAIADNVCLDMEQAPGAPFHFVIEGELTLVSGASERLLKRGDVVLLPHWDRYLIQVGGGDIRQSIRQVVSERTIPQWSDTAGLDVPLHIEIGEPPYVVRLLSGIVGFRPEVAGLTTFNFPPVIIFRGDDEKLTDILRTSLALVRRELDHTEPGFAAVSSRALELFCVQALREWLLHSDGQSGLAAAVKNPRMRRVLEAVHAQPGLRWTLHSLARVAGRSRSAFAQEFVETMGRTAFDYLREVRMRKAASMLSTGSNSVAEIGAMLGYLSGAAFVRAFAAETGITPSQYRKTARAPVSASLKGSKA